MKQRLILTLCAVCFVAVGLALSAGGSSYLSTDSISCKVAELTQADDPEVERYFHDRDTKYDQDLYCAARRIAAKEPLSDSALDLLKRKVNQRAGDDITLLPFAALKQNLAALDQLFAYGADPYLPLKRKGPSAYDSLISVVSEGDYPIATEIMMLYLKHGGDPNYRGGVNNTPLIANTALMQNFDSYRLLIDHGADVWKKEGPSRFSHDGPLPEDQIVAPLQDEKYFSTAIYIAARVASRKNDYRFLDYAFDKGVLRQADRKQVGYLIEWIGSYELRNDPISRSIVARVRRVLLETNYPGNEESEKILEYAWKEGW